ncbi:MAG TPA: serine hydrolase domain-containing protein [Vicinamibacterales bacterium]|nr:serine hydrolase domain-containing protein [Vicinamibacterales bacterium]
MNTKHVTGSLGEAIAPFVASGQLAGAAALIWKDGEIEQVVALGSRDLASGAPVERDTLFRIASLTKPVVTVAALSMFDEGRFELDDPIVACAPELDKMRVLRDPDGPLDQCDLAVRAITFRDLLTHRSGLTYGDFHHGPIGRAYADALGPHIDNPLTPDEWIGRLATLPLIDQPGAGFHYGHSTDLLGFLLARLDNAPLGTVLERRVFTPLGMRDTGFTVPASTRHRRASLCGFDNEGKLTTLIATPGGHALAERPDRMTFESGGQGLWSTVDDYLAFARMLIDDRARNPPLLRQETLALMTSNQLTPAQRATTRMFGQSIFAGGHGYGMGVAVVIDPATADPLRCCGGVGTIGWPGAYGSWWQADPNDRSVLIFFSHNMVDLEQMSRGIGLGVWDAISRLHRIATS